MWNWFVNGSDSTNCQRINSTKSLIWWLRPMIGLILYHATHKKVLWACSVDATYVSPYLSLNIPQKWGVDEIWTYGLVVALAMISCQRTNSTKRLSWWLKTQNWFHTLSPSLAHEESISLLRSLSLRAWKLSYMLKIQRMILVVLTLSTLYSIVQNNVCIRDQL